MLTLLSYCDTIMQTLEVDTMSNNLKTEKQVACISALCEGASIRSVERMTGIHRDTIMRLGVRVGKGCMRMLDKKMRGLEMEDIQIDEIWTYIGKHQAQLKKDDPREFGDCYTFFAIDSQTKLVPNFKVGKRDYPTAARFISDLSTRVKNKPQLNTDGLAAYARAIQETFGRDIDYSVIVKSFVGKEPPFKFCPRSWYDSSTVCHTEKTIVSGAPERDRMSTSFVERHNLTVRTMNKRMARLTLCFSKKLENFVASVGLYLAYYNFCRTHSTLRATPAQAHGVDPRRWTVADLVELSV